MNPILIQPTDLLFFRDAVPMSAGQGKGSGCRMPFPSTLHEALRGSLLRANGGLVWGKGQEGRPRSAPRSGNWHAEGHDGKTYIASREFRSLRTIGPLPFLEQVGKEGTVEPNVCGLLLPVPLDVAFESPPSAALARLRLWRDPSVPVSQDCLTPSDWRPLCLPMSVTPPAKQAQLSGWWTTRQYQAYLEIGVGGAAREDAKGSSFQPLPTEKLWEPEYRVGAEIDPASFAAKKGQLYAGTHLRPHSRMRFAAWAGIADPGKARTEEAEVRRREQRQLEALDWLLLGGEFRLARLWHGRPGDQSALNNIQQLQIAPKPPRNGPCLLKWVLVTPAIFSNGSLPGWCADTKRERFDSAVPIGRVCVDLPGRAHLISWRLDKPLTVSGWDVVEQRAKPTRLATPAGSVFYFLCEDVRTAAALATKLHWQPRSDFFGEKGCGYGLVSFDVTMHPDSADVRAFASELFTR